MTRNMEREGERNRRLSNFNFDEDLLSDIRSGRGLAASQLNKVIVAARDGEGSTLLHLAARHDNPLATQRLIEFGSEVDALAAGRTALMLAVQRGSASTVAALLEADADMHLTDDDGQNALGMALERDCLSSGILAFISTLRAKTRTTSELAAILINAGANMYHACDSNDIELMERMLEQGIHVDSRAHRGKTGLHEAATWNRVKSAEWLMDHGADVNALDDDGESPLLLAACHRVRDVLKILLERGADPNLKNPVDDSTPLFALFEKFKCRFCERNVECVDLLLRYGAVPRNSSVIAGTIFDHAVDRSSDEAIRMLISQLAMLEMRGASITKSGMRCDDPSRRSKVVDFEAFHEACLRILESPVFGKLSLSDLLNGSEGRLQLWARNEEFVPEVRKACFELKLDESNSYYLRRAMERIDRASRVVMLQNEAVPVVCKLFNGNFDEFYISARMVIDYLNVSDLKNLVLIAKTLIT